MFLMTLLLLVLRFLFLVLGLFGRHHVAVAIAVIVTIVQHPIVSLGVTLRHHVARVLCDVTGRWVCWPVLLPALVLREVCFMAVLF